MYSREWMAVHEIGEHAKSPRRGCSIPSRMGMPHGSA